MAAREGFKDRKRKRLYQWKSLWVLLILCSAAGYIGLKRGERELDPYRERAEIYDLELIDDVELPSLILDREGRELGRIFVENRSLISIEEIPDNFINALLAQEDQRFFKHKGVDWIGVVRAVYLNLKAREVTQGASTITMQLARNAFDLQSEARERGESGMERKMVEAFLALRIEKWMGRNFPGAEGREAKSKILELYLNRIPFGSGYYGIRSAALGYYGKEPVDLTVDECASIVACIKNPTILSPLRSPEANERARNHVLNRMLAEKTISSADWLRLTSLPVKVNPKPLRRGTSHLYEKIAGIARDRVGLEAMSSGGFRIFTTIDRSVQDQAQKSLQAHLRQIEETPGYTHPQHADFQKADGRKPAYLQGAALMVDSRTGAVLAHVGGRDFVHSQFDIVELGRRPLGTAFLPVIYTAAFENGRHPSSSVRDQPMDNRAVMIGGREGILGEWGMETPQPRYEGQITSRRALAASKVAASVRLGMEIGLDKIDGQARKFGLSNARGELLNRLLLGWEPASLTETVTAYSAFSQGGAVPTGRHYLERIEDAEGRTVYKAVNQGGTREVCDPISAYQVHSVLQDTTRSGNLMAQGPQVGGEAFAGAVKTGSTHNFSDGWCVGYNGSVTLGVWVGFLDGSESIHEGAFGKQLAFPIWADAMNVAQTAFPGKEADVPRGLETVTLCRRSGLMATRYCYDTVEDPNRGVTFRSTAYKELLRAGTGQIGYCDVHGQGGVAVEDILADYGPERGTPVTQERLSVIPIRPQAPALVGSDPYNSITLSLAPEDESDDKRRGGPTLLLDYGVRGEEEASLRLPRPGKLEIAAE